ncbi:MAG TPA: hypothetical protein VIJ94_10990 [Caulobacteraceae bacterium]
MSPYETRLLALLERLEATLAEVRDLLLRQGEPADTATAQEVEAFADEALRDRDA